MKFFLYENSCENNKKKEKAPKTDELFSYDKNELLYACSVEEHDRISNRLDHLLNQGRYVDADKFLRRKENKNYYLPHFMLRARRHYDALNTDFLA